MYKIAYSALNPVGKTFVVENVSDYEIKNNFMFVKRSDADLGVVNGIINLASIRDLVIIENQAIIAAEQKKQATAVKKKTKGRPKKGEPVKYSVDDEEDSFGGF